MAVLKFKHNKKEYTSNPWDFKAMCFINERNNDGVTKGPLLMCTEAVDYMFEGTEGAEVLKEIAPGVRSHLCIELWKLYIEELARKNG